MLYGWSVLTGVVGTLIANHLIRLQRSWRQGSQCQRTTSLHQIDHYSCLQSIAVNRNSLPADLKLGPTLGSGAFGTVYKGGQTNDMSRRPVAYMRLPDAMEQPLYASVSHLHHTGTWKGVKVAVKTMEHQCAGSRSYIAVAMEKLLGIASVHPNVVSALVCPVSALSCLLLHSFPDRGLDMLTSHVTRILQVAVYAVMTEELPSEAPCTLKSSIVMELCDSKSLLHHRERVWGVLERNQSKGMHMVLKCLIEVLFGMEYLHSIGITHGDLKCANVLCSSKRLDARGWVCKIGDFGLSESRDSFEDHCSSHPGTAVFAAPEVLAGGRKGFKSDVYAFGILAWHLVSLGSSEVEMQDGQIMYQVCERGWRPELPERTPTAFKELVLSCWRKDGNERPSFSQLRGPLTALLSAYPLVR